MKEGVAEIAREVASSTSFSVTTMAVTLATGIGSWFNLIPSDVGKLAFVITFLIFIPLFFYRLLMIRRELLLQKREILEQLIMETEHNRAMEANKKILL